MRHRPRFRPRTFALEPEPELARWWGALAELRSPIWLDSAGGAPRRHSLIAFDPLSEDCGATPHDLAELARAMEADPRDGGDRPPEAFHGGFVGALAYDLGVAGERQRLPADPWALPRVVGGFYTDYVVRDHFAGRTTLVLGEEPGDGRPSVAERRERLQALLARPQAALGCVPAGPLRRCVPTAEHVRRIEELRVRIAAGELYQANLAHRFTRTMQGSPLALYASLRARHPAPYQAYLSWGGAGGRPAGALLSASPELLLECDGRRLRTRPIKGTAPRQADPIEDERAAAALLASRKDLAELAMIVDLERNDLGRVARTGSVVVAGFPTLESYATVHHLVADVRAELAPGRRAVDALGALFPGGSISGAPKLAAMREIARLEGEGRGFFSGSAGFLDWSGRAAFNILIRTLVWRPLAAEGAGELSWHVGGGITWDSRAAAEDEETLHKGAALVRALEAGPAAVDDALGRAWGDTRDTQLRPASCDGARSLD